MIRIIALVLLLMLGGCATSQSITKRYRCYEETRCPACENWKPDPNKPFDSCAGLAYETGNTICEEIR